MLSLLQTYLALYPTKLEMQNRGIRSPSTHSVQICVKFINTPLKMLSINWQTIWTRHVASLPIYLLWQLAGHKLPNVRVQYLSLTSNINSQLLDLQVRVSSARSNRLCLFLFKWYILLKYVNVSEIIPCVVDGNGSSSPSRAKGGKISGTSWGAPTRVYVPW